MNVNEDAKTLSVNSRAKYLQSIKDKLQKAADDTYSQLVTDQIYGRLPEDLFVSNFLPYFTGKLKVEEGNNVIPLWISIAGNPTSRVCILDKNGEVLYTVPPIFDTGILNTLDSKNRKLAEIYHNYTIRKDNLPMAADNFLDSAMAEKYNTILSNIVNQKYQKEWQDIFDRYNVNVEIKKTKDESYLDEDFFDFT